MSDVNWRLDWPVAGGERPGRARLKEQAEDFRVDEVLPLERDGAGEHLCLYIEKRGDNTEYLARQLARLADCRPMDVGFCGLKDRHSVTRQWFSLYRPGKEAEDQALMGRISESWKVVDQVRLPRKLRRGDHQGNRFRILLRHVEGDREALEAGLRRLASEGCPNYFGPQRFGHDGGNLDHAANLDPADIRSGGSRKRRRGRQSTGSGSSKNVLYFSAARSWLFNEILARRVSDGSWKRVIEGEPDQHASAPTGPLWGDGGTAATGMQEKMERDLVGQWPTLARLFADTRMKPERRSLVCMPRELEWQWSGVDQLELEFGLLPGQYATAVLGELFDL